MRSFVTLCMLLTLSACVPSLDHNKLVSITGTMGLCTAFQITAPSGQNYLMSAGHCGMLADEQGNVAVHLESGAVITRHVIKEDHTGLDLLLLEGLPGISGYRVASEAPRIGDYLRVLGHGLGLPLYERGGIVIGETQTEHCTELVTTCDVQPGHSGSPVFNESEQVVGVVSMGGMSLGLFVRLEDIKSFLKGY